MSCSLTALAGLLLLRLGVLACTYHRLRRVPRRVAPARRAVLLVLSGVLGVGSALAVLLLELTTGETPWGGSPFGPAAQGFAVGWAFVWPISAFICNFEMRARWSCWRYVGAQWLASFKGLVESPYKEHEEVQNNST